MLRAATLCLVLSIGALPPPAVSCADARVERYESRTFLGYACEDDCERHKAGFRWAERHSVSDRRRCASLRQSEAEGCLAYVDERRGSVRAGRRWALENEILRSCHCHGAGERFRVGCLQVLEGVPDPLS